MRLVNAVLVIADVSGYTSFIRHRAVSLVHAEAIVTELLESVLDRASHPLIVNKLEGDAVPLYAHHKHIDADNGAHPEVNLEQDISYPGLLRVVEPLSPNGHLYVAYSENSFASSTHSPWGASR